MLFSHQWALKLCKAVSDKCRPATGTTAGVGVQSRSFLPSCPVRPSRPPRPRRPTGTCAGRPAGPAPARRGPGPGGARGGASGNASLGEPVTSRSEERAVQRARQEFNAGPALQPTRWTQGGAQLPLRIDGEVAFGQYMRSIGMKSPRGAGSQLLSLSAPGDSAWKYSVVDPSGLVLRLLRGLTVNLFSGLGTNHQPWSISYIVMDQKPSTGGVRPAAKVSVYLFAPFSAPPSLSTVV